MSQTLATISMAFENFTEGKAKLRMITGHRFKTGDLNLFTKLFSEKYTKSHEFTSFLIFTITRSFIIPNSKQLCASI